MIQIIEVNFLAQLIVSECFAMPFSFFLPPFPSWKLEMRIHTSLYRATDEEHQVRIRMKVKLVLSQWTRTQPCVINFVVLFVFLSHWLMCTVAGGKEQLHVCSSIGEGRTLITPPAHLTFSGKATHKVQYWQSWDTCSAWVLPHFKT